MSQLILLSFLIFTAAILYSSVGQAGGSGYLAAMAFVGLAPEVMKPSALVLNLLVAAVGTVRFFRAGLLSWRLVLPFAVGSAPLAFAGGVISLPDSIYNPAVGSILIFAAIWLLMPLKTPSEGPATKTAPFIAATFCGAVIGFLSGLTGTGGGIFLSPLLLWTGWANAKESAGASAPFILINSIAAIIGHLAKVASLPSEIPLWAAAAFAGGLIGSEIGSRRLGSVALRRLLAIVLLIAGGKLLVT